jgi:ComF family protein
MWLHAIRSALNLLFPVRSSAHLVRLLSAEQLFTHMRPQLSLHTDPPTHVLLPYRLALVRAAILEAKFHDDRNAQDALGAILERYLTYIWCENRYLRDTHTLVLIPIPLSRERVRERGYNQTERICRAAARISPDIQVDSDLLTRSRNTPPQTTLNGNERRTNLAGAFILTRTPMSSAIHILVDDVLTTGTTLSAAITAFDSTDAHILSIALAH